ncbi:hypothetical protein BCR32DRAFT_263791 [Anaeromyces robustus]|jgi:hypothetical protein|uniref:L domain-like protein n=1 Tax=Anaeromyces robustus TaxID=1754192 RepID=A0A1Y1XQV6_9FUNG|nr:hypothetical protein BCR32DRAFT_263791 [Anaeromyces robustus]|eukprot:ORX88117.1 hypothetical protein BCR32DRAFT_263791 [Anaeromyces robustus]
MRFLKKNLLLAVASVLYLGSKVEATTDCEYLEKAIKYFNDDLKKHFKVDKCCDFNGVRCDADKNIREIKFNNVNKTKDFGSFIEKISKIKNLNYLDLSNDNIEGSIPKAICSISTLKNLNLSKNKLKGTIPYNCTLDNLEQLNLHGNKDLTGYIPVFPKVRGCAFQETTLCDVPNSYCKNAPKNCTEEDYTKTNAANGNPDKKSNTYINADVKDRDFGLYDNYNGYSYGYTGYDDYSNYGNYDLNNYYGSTPYGYGYGDWGYYNGYDNSYYDNGYYGTGYDNYAGTGYDTSFYDNGYYNNFDPSWGYGTDNFPSGTTGPQNTYYGKPNAHSGAFRSYDAGKFFLSMIVAVVFIALGYF